MVLFAVLGDGPGWVLAEADADAWLKNSLARALANERRDRRPRSCGK